jgi:hypothetical protein
MPSNGTRRRWRTLALIFTFSAAASAGAADPPTPPSPATPGTPATSAAPAASDTPKTPAKPEVPAKPAVCLESGDGYLRAHVAGAVEASVDWPNQGTRCEGEPKDTPPGVRLSFRRSPSGAQDLLFVFGITGVREGRAAREVGANLTLIVQGKIYGTLGDSRCTVDSLSQRRVGHAKTYRLEARGFCTQPAHAVRGEGAVLVSTFEFAGLVDYAVPQDDAPAK